jgi:hypothetical protein
LKDGEGRVTTVLSQYEMRGSWWRTQTVPGTCHLGAFISPTDENWGLKRAGDPWTGIRNLLVCVSETAGVVVFVECRLRNIAIYLDLLSYNPSLCIIENPSCCSGKTYSFFGELEEAFLMIPKKRSTRARKLVEKQAPKRLAF